MAAVLRDANHLRALVFMALIMFSGFTVIPYITIYVTANVGIRQQDIPLIYLVGGCATFFTSRLVGRLADAHGKIRVYRWMALCSMVPLFVQTHLVPVPLWVMIVCSTVFFVFVPGRMVPAMAIVTSAVQPRLRGTFLSMNGAVQQLSSGTASYIAGAMIAVDASGHIVGYGAVGYLAIAATLIAMVFVGQIQMHTGTPATMTPMRP
jgi:predicted MFS family arabinose efflux permease